MSLLATFEIEETKTVVCFVGLPEGAMLPFINIIGDVFSYSVNGTPNIINFSTPGFDLLGTYPGLDEGKLEAVMPFHQLDHGRLYYNFNGDDFLTTALESLQSLMRHLQLYTVNPYGSVPACGCMGPSDLGACPACDEFVEAQSRTFKQFAVLTKKLDR